MQVLTDDKKRIQIVQKYPLTEHMPNSKRIISFKKTRVNAKIHKYYNRVVREWIELQKDLFIVNRDNGLDISDT